MKLTEEEQALRDLVFWEQLQSQSIEKVEQAFEMARRDLDFFPTVNMILEFIAEINRVQSPPRKPELIGWSQPTEEGREIAKGFIREIYDHVDSINQKKEEERRRSFEAKREILRKQAKMMGVKREPGIEG